MNNTLLQSLLVLFIFTIDYFSIQTTEAWHHHQSFLPPASCFIPSSGGTSSSRVSCPIRTKQQEQHDNTAKATTTSLYEKFYTKGAEIYPTCNNKQFTLADSFPNGTIPPRAQSILKEKNVDIPLAAAALSSPLSSDPMTLSVTSLSRRNVFLLGGAGISTTLAAMGIQNRRIDDGITGNAIMTTTTTSTATTMDVSQAIEWLDQYCDRRFLHAMVASDYKFLYYGIGNNNNAAGIRTVTLPPSDLLSVETYGSQKAVDYFQNLESKLENEYVKPSNGHLMTTSEKDAAEWGSVASMWPMDGAHFAWFGDLKPFFDARHVDEDNRREELIVDGKDCGRDGLEDALRGDHTEVLVNARQYLVVPVEFDEELRNALKSSFLV